MPDGASIACRHRPAPEGAVTLLFCPGFRSSMDGAKAMHLDRLAAGAGLGCLRFDYRGHGLSGGRFEALAIGDWRADVVTLIDQVVPGPVLLVGSSMGGWLAVLAALDRPERVAGLVTVAAAPDFTEEVLRPGLTAGQHRVLAEDGVVTFPGRYGDGPYPITRRLLEEGAAHRVLTGPRLPIRAPVRLVHGLADADVPWRLSLRLAEAIEGPDVRLTLIKDGDHRLSRPRDLDLLAATVLEVVSGSSASASGAGG